MADSLSSRQNVLYVSSAQEQRCGVYEFGQAVGAALLESRNYRFVFVECSNPVDLEKAASQHRPVAIIYNYHPGTLAWVTSRVTGKIHVPQIGTIHECSQASVDHATNEVFDAHVAPDPTLLLRNPLVFKTGRCIPPYVNTSPLPEIPTIGSFGFGLAGKGFERVIETVEREFERARVRLHIPFSPIMDPNGTFAAETRARCERLVTKPGIQLSISHHFLSKEDMLGFLAGNSINVFFYDDYGDRGLSSATDYALAVERPVALTRSTMFRHFNVVAPSVYVEDCTLKEILARGFAPLEPLRREWSNANLIWDYERIVSRMLAKPPRPPLRRRHPFLARVRSALRRLRGGLQRPAPPATANWVRPDTSGILEGAANQAQDYLAVVNKGASPFNRILDNAAREQYGPAINELLRLAPDLLARKIPEANVQQGFILDTVLRLISDARVKGVTAPRLLCIGSYEDSAAASLKRLGYHLDEIDPVLNFDLSEFCSRPSTKKESYDVVFSTSVLEHVEDDQQFMLDISTLLAPEGTAALTCDFRDQYKPGDKKPQVDVRLYTQQDLIHRLLPVIKDCELVDAPEWDCVEPDFYFEGCRYTFASIVFRKRSKSL
jgi:SAM-dependent methyltransferase